MSEWVIVVITVLTIFGGSALIVLIQYCRSATIVIKEFSELFPKLIKVLEEKECD